MNNRERENNIFNFRKETLIPRKFTDKGMQTDVTKQDMDKVNKNNIDK